MVKEQCDVSINIILSILKILSILSNSSQERFSFLKFKMQSCARKRTVS